MNLPATAEGILPEFWDTPAGEQQAQALWIVNQHEALSLADAARLMGVEANPRGIMYVEARLPLYRKPRAAMHYRRPAYRRSGEGTTRAWYVLRSDVNALLVQG